MSTLSTHVLDVSRGRPAEKLPIVLEALGDGGWRELASGVTDGDGRIKNFLREGLKLSAGIYRLTFDTGAYFEAKKERGFYPYVNVTFEIAPQDEHYHVPLLLSPWGYSTYRGS